MPQLAISPLNSTFVYFLTDIMDAPAAGGPARAGGVRPVLGFADKLAAEEAALKAAVVDEFEFIEVLGNGCNGIAVEVRHLNPANPYCKSKVCFVYTPLAEA